LFTGEEVNMQGSWAYVKQRDWPLPVTVLNLEGWAQNGNYVYWEQDGSIFRLLPTADSVNRTLCVAIEEVTGEIAKPAGPVTSDGGSFVAAGIPATTTGMMDQHLGITGLHRPTDNLDRVVFERLPEGVDILEAFLQSLPSEEQNE
jgi:hypothetical protein